MPTLLVRPCLSVGHEAGKRRFTRRYTYQVSKKKLHVLENSGQSCNSCVREPVTVDILCDEIDTLYVEGDSLGVVVSMC